MERLLDKEDDRGCIETCWKDLKLLLELHQKGKLDRMNPGIMQFSPRSGIEVLYLTAFLPVRKATCE
jgi:hypothetical protein